MNRTKATGTRPNGQAAYPLVFDLGNGYPYTMQVVDVNSYAAWEPVRINSAADSGTGAFYINATGLQWTSAPVGSPRGNTFDGWIVCNWWYGVPQLFARFPFGSSTTPCSCANVELEVQYF